MSFVPLSKSFVIPVQSGFFRLSVCARNTKAAAYVKTALRRLVLLS